MEFSNTIERIESYSSTPWCWLLRMNCKWFLRATLVCTMHMHSNPKRNTMRMEEKQARRERTWHTRRHKIRDSSISQWFAAKILIVISNACSSACRNCYQLVFGVITHPYWRHILNRLMLKRSCERHTLLCVFQIHMDDSYAPNWMYGSFVRFYICFAFVRAHLSRCNKFHSFWIKFNKYIHSTMEFSNWRMSSSVRRCSFYSTSAQHTHTHSHTSIHRNRHLTQRPCRFTSSVNEVWRNGTDYSATLANLFQIVYTYTLSMANFIRLLT